MFDIQIDAKKPIWDWKFTEVFLSKKVYWSIWVTIILLWLKNSNCLIIEVL